MKRTFIGSHDDNDPVELAIWAARLSGRCGFELKFDGLIDERVVVAYAGDGDATEEEMREWVHS